MPKQDKEKAKIVVFAFFDTLAPLAKQAGNPPFWLDDCGNITSIQYHFGDIFFVKY